MSSAEQVRSYLTNKHIDTLLKWMATELAVHKPDDPLTFIYILGC